MPIEHLTVTLEDSDGNVVESMTSGVSASDSLSIEFSEAAQTGGQGYGSGSYGSFGYGGD